MKQNLLRTFILLLITATSFNSYSQSGEALNFDGVDDYVSLPFGLSGSYTKEVWINPDNVAGFPNIISGSGTALFLNNMQLAAGHQNDSYADVLDPTPLTPGTWYHVAVTYNAGNNEMNLYTNGVLVATATSVAYAEPSLELGRFAGANFFSGSMDEVRIWNIVRSQSEISNDMVCSLPSVSGIQAYYNFNEGTAGANNAGQTSLFDRSNYCSPSTGTLNNFALNGSTSNWIAPGAPTGGNCDSGIPIIHVAGNNLCILTGDVTPNVADGTNFGLYLNNPITKTFRINNSGTIDLTISSVISSSADFTLITPPSSVIPGGGSSTFTIQFLPSGSFGIKNATITVNSDDVSLPVYTFDVTGEYQSQGQSLNFDGSDFINLPFAISGSYTKEAWIKTDNVGGFPNIITGSETALFLNNLQLAAGHAPSFNQVLDPTPLTPGVWYHIAVTYDNSTGEMKLYKDGVEVSNGIAPAYSETNLVIGTFGSNYFSGNIDEVRIWNNVRTAAQINASKDCRLNDDVGQGLIAYYDFNQGAAGQFNFTETTLKDRHDSCVALDGTLVNFNNSGTSGNWVSDSPFGAVYCNGIRPNIKVTGFTNCILDGDLTPDPANGTDFGLYSPGSPVIRTFVIKNTGSDVLTIAQPVITGPDYIYFAVISDPAYVIYPGEETSFQVRFTASTLGIKNAFITIANNDADESSYNFAIRGERQAALPVTILSFNGNVAGKDVKLSWTTTNEINFRGYEILRSDADQRRWESIGFVAAENLSNASYNFYDHNPVNGINTYRLKQIDNNAGFRLSNIVNVNIVVKEALVKTFPNPFTTSFSITFNDQKLLNTNAVIRSVSGAIVKEIKLLNYHTNVDLSALPKGMYMITLSNGEVYKLIKQ